MIRIQTNNYTPALIWGEGGGANLNFGKVSLDKECKFVVTKQEEINKLICIFDRYNLNTTKYLDYIDFKKAFLIYQGRDGLVAQELKEQILALKNEHTTFRLQYASKPSD